MGSYITRKWTGQDANQAWRQQMAYQAPMQYGYGAAQGMGDIEMRNADNMARMEAAIAQAKAAEKGSFLTSINALTDTTKNITGLFSDPWERDK